MLDLLPIELQQILDRGILLYALVAGRIAPIVMLVPYLGGKAVPQTVKMGLILALTVLVYPAVWSTGAADALPQDTFAIFTLILKELMIGFTFGFVASLVFESTRVAGQIIDNARGQTMATTLVPQLPERVSLTSNIFYQMTVVTFLLLGGHRIFLAGLVRSFGSIPPQSMPNVSVASLDLALLILRLGADAITLGVVLAFPVTAAVLLTDMCLALVNKAAPQIRVFFLGMPLKAMLGILVFFLGLQVVVDRAVTEAMVATRALEGVVESVASPPPSTAPTPGGAP